MKPVDAEGARVGAAMVHETGLVTTGSSVHPIHVTGSVGEEDDVAVVVYGHVCAESEQEHGEGCGSD